MGDRFFTVSKPDGQALMRVALSRYHLVEDIHLIIEIGADYDKNRDQISIET